MPLKKSNASWIELDIVDSTNNYAMGLVHAGVAQHGTVVFAHHQNKGKGQRGKNWETEPGANLSFSIILQPHFLLPTQMFQLLAVTALSVRQELEKLIGDEAKIKWPNDLYWRDRKTGGILIENSFKSNGEVVSIIGIGLNVNQLYFEKAPNATSLHFISGRNYNLDDLLLDFCTSIKQNLILIEKESEKIWTNYHQKLFKKDTPMAFEDTKGKKFMGIIQKVSYDGLLHILLEDDSIAQFGIKEIKMLY